MNSATKKEASSIMHRRHRTAESYEWWNYLNYAQKFAVSSLFKFGYTIEFVRTEEHKTLVVMTINGNTVTVDSDGLVDTNPSIQLREK